MCTVWWDVVMCVRDPRQLLMAVAQYDTPRDIYLMVLGSLYDRQRLHPTARSLLCRVMKIGTCATAV